MRNLKIIISLLLLLSLGQLVFAQNNSTHQNMPDISDSNKGVEVMLQLELRIDEMIQKANTIIEEVQIRNNLELEDELIVRLESYIDSLDEVKNDLKFEREQFEEELNSINQEENDFIIEEMREEIYATIKEVRSITNDFRSTIAPLLDEEQKEQIRQEAKKRVEEFKERRDERREEIKNKIEEQRKKSILNRAKEFENTTGIEGVSSHAQQLANGEITIEEFRQRIVQFARENREENIRQSIDEKKQEREEIREQRRELIEERVSARIERNKQRREQRIQERINRTKERLQERREELTNRREELTNRREETRQQIQQRVENNNISVEEVRTLTTNEVVEIIESLSPEEKERISQEVGVDVALVPESVLREIISNLSEEEIETYINQAQLDVPVEITQQGRINGDDTR